MSHIIKDANGANQTFKSTPDTGELVPHVRVDNFPNNGSTETTLASLLAKVIAAPATEAKQDTIVALLTLLNSYSDGSEALLTQIRDKIIASPATETTLAAVLNKIIAAPATEAKQDSAIASLLQIRDKIIAAPATEATLAAVLAKIIAAPATEAKQDSAITQLTNILARLAPLATEIPGDDTDGNATPVRAMPQHITRIGFTKAIANSVDPDWGSVLVTGAGMTVNQTGGNLVITAGTNARSETIIRSNLAWKGGVRARCRNTLSQRIANNNFVVELVDVIGDNLNYTIVSATVMEVTIPNNPFTAQNIGQSVSIGAFAGTGTFLSGRYVIAGVAGNVVTFTVSGFAAGSGTCSVFGWNFYRLVYRGTTATNAFWDTARNGYASGDTTVTINTTATPGHLAIMTGNDLKATLADQLVASSGAIQQTVRASRVENVPDDVALRMQIRVFNDAAAPASNTTWTIGFVSVGNYANQDVALQDVMPMHPAVALPVEIMRAVALSITGTVTTSLTSTTANFGTNGMSAFADSSTNLAASATFTGTSRDGGTTQAFARFVARAFADVAGTMRIEQSADGTVWRRATPDTAVAAGAVVELNVVATARFHRVIYINGAGAQTAFLLNSAYLRI